LNSSSDTDTRIDDFVRQVNARLRRRIRAEDLPPEFREGEPEHGLYYDWRIQPFSNARWITPIEAILQRPLPPSYRSLVTRYVFPAFECGPLILLANTGQSLYHEMSAVLLRNQATCRALLDSGYIQFARPATGESDPICFNYNRVDEYGEPHMVRIHQQSLLSHDGLQIAEDLGISFRALLDKLLQPESQHA